MSENLKYLRFFRTKNTVIREMLSEFIGTFILILMINSSIATQLLSRTPQTDPTPVGIASGIGLMIAVYLGANISGGLVNPAVTLAFATAGKLPWKKVPHYFLAQYLGAFAASLIAYANCYSAINEFDGGVRSAFGNTTSTAGILTTNPSPFLPVWGAFLDQVIAVSLLQFGIMSLVDEKNANVNKSVFPLCVGLLLAGIVMAFGVNTGPVMNPARDISGRIVASIVGYGSDVWSARNHTYWLIGGLLGPHLGALIGQWFYYLFAGLHLDRTDGEILEYKTEERKIIVE